VSLVIIALGYLAKRFYVVKESDGDGLSRIVLNFTLPATVITVFSTIQIDKSLFLMPFMNIMYCILLASVAFIIFRKQPREEKGMLTMQFASFNIGLFAYPLIEATWGSNGLKYFGMFDMGNSLMTFGAAYVIQLRTVNLPGAYLNTVSCVCCNTCIVNFTFVISAFFSLYMLNNCQSKYANVTAASWYILKLFV